MEGDATDASAVSLAVKDADVVVHAVGLLFDSTTPGGGILNLVVSGSKSRPAPSSTYDAVTRQTALHVVAALKGRLPNPFAGTRKPALVFVSAAEAGWPEVTYGDRVEALAPAPLVRYLEAKRAVEAALLRERGAFRAVIMRPSLIWDWSKLDVLPIIPFFNVAAALGVPFVDRTVRVETLAGSVVAAIEDGAVEGVQRVGEMEALAAQVA